MIDPLTSDETLRVNGHRVTATDLAKARQQLAHDGTGYVPPWDDLSKEQQRKDALIAAGYLRSLANLLRSLANIIGPVHDPHNGTPVLHGPDYTEQTPTVDLLNEPCLTEPDSAGWDLSGGARISFGKHDDDGELMVTLSISDYALRTGIVQRGVTRKQLAEHAEHLLRIAGATLAITLPDGQ